MFQGIRVYKAKRYIEKSIVLPSQVRRNIEYMCAKGENYTLNGASIILAELLGVLLGLRRSEHFASAETNPDRTSLLCFRNLAWVKWDLADMTNMPNIPLWAEKLEVYETFRIRLCYTKHKRHRVAHEVVAGPGYRVMNLVRWIKVVVKLRLRHKERLFADSPILVRVSKGRIVPMTASFMSRMDKNYASILQRGKATIHSRRRGFATAAVRCGIHMARISTAMRHSRGVTMQYVELPIADKALITTSLAVHSYKETWEISKSQT